MSSCEKTREKLIEPKALLTLKGGALLGGPKYISIVAQISLLFPLATLGPGANSTNMIFKYLYRSSRGLVS